MNIFRLLQIHLELECITFDHRGDLIFLPCPDPDAYPRVYLGHHAQGYITLFHHDFPPDLRDQINVLSPEQIFAEPERVQAIIARDNPSTKISSTQSYIFQQRITPTQFPDVTRLERNQSELFADPSKILEATTFAILRDGETVSACESSRENKVAAEAWVRTSEDYRRRGYARQTTYAWAHDLQSRNKIPFYSHKFDDLASESFAHSLALSHWLTDLSFS